MGLTSNVKLFSIRPRRLMTLHNLLLPLTPFLQNFQNLFKTIPRKYFRGVLYVSHETLFTIKLTGDELAPGFAGGLGDDDGEILAVHEGNNVGKIALESGGNGVVLFLAADDGKDGLFRSFGVHVSVQRPCVNRDALSVLKVFDVHALCAGQLIQGFLVVVDVGNVGVDDVHIYFPFWPVNLQYREAVPDRQALLGLFRHFVKNVRNVIPCYVTLIL